MAWSPAERHSFCRKALFRQKEALSAEYRFRQKFIILKQALSTIGRKRKNLFHLISTINKVVFSFQVLSTGRGHGADWDFRQPEAHAGATTRLERPSMRHALDTAGKLWIFFWIFVVSIIMLMFHRRFGTAPSATSSSPTGLITAPSAESASSRWVSNTGSCKYSKNAKLSIQEI